MTTPCSFTRLLRDTKNVSAQAETYEEEPERARARRGREGRARLLHPVERSCEQTARASRVAYGSTVGTYAFAREDYGDRGSS